MAGAGFKTFNTGDVLTASDVNTYLMQQTVMVFASAAARTTALGANVAEGMLSYLKDTNAVEVYDGSNWVSSDDPNAIQNTIVDAKGDLISATAADTPARLASSGTNGDVLTVDTSTATGLKWATPSSGATSLGFAAGKNRIINGDFGIWQRGTSFALANATNTFTADRFLCQQTFTSGSPTVTQQTFTAGTAPVSGYEGQYFLRHTLGTGNLYFATFQRIEDVRTYAGQTVTFSFWAKASASISAATIFWSQNFGSGGSATVTNTTTTSSIGTSWARYTASISIPSISGKTIGAGSFLTIGLDTSNAPSLTNGMTIDTWGWQLEAGSTATSFQTATGTIQGELAACQRYYIRLNDSTSSLFANGNARSATNTNFLCNLPVSMRTRPTSVDYTSLQISDGVTNYAVTSLTSGIGNQSQQYLDAGVSSGLTQFRPMFLQQNGSTGYVAFSAEL